jgi:hypothetical protein
VRKNKAKIHYMPQNRGITACKEGGVYAPHILGLPLHCDLETAGQIHVVAIQDQC